MKRTVEVDGKRIRYDCPNDGTVWRAETLFTKEPDTIAWIDSFRPGDKFMDIGANVGMYTIYAAGIRDIDVVAFEPEATNFSLLLSNIRLNGLDNKVTAYPVAMTNVAGFGSFQVSALNAGGSGHTFGETALSQGLTPKASQGRQGMYATTIDDYCVDYAPDHIKIDVDALEHLIIEGGKKTLANHLPRSVLCEINTNIEEHRDIINTMKWHGYKCTIAEGAIRPEGPFKGIGNHIFHAT